MSHTLMPRLLPRRRSARPGAHRRRVRAPLTLAGLAGLACVAGWLMTSHGGLQKASGVARTAGAPVTAPASRPERVWFAWPVRPFHRAHPLRATFGEPRALLGLGLALRGAARAEALNRMDQIASAGHRSLHTGVDIVAPDGTPVYAVASGVAVTAGTGYERHVAVGRFQYWHLAGAVPSGAGVVAFRTVIGRVYPGQGHVHLTRLGADGEPVNPLTSGGLTPYVDTAPPRLAILDAYRRDGSRAPLDALRGPVVLALKAYDVQSTGGLETGLYSLGWTLTRIGSGRLVAGPFELFRFDILPPDPIGERLYTVGSTRHQTHPNFWYRLTTEPVGSSPLLRGDVLHTELLQPGRYRLEVVAADARGNRASRTFILGVASVGRVANTASRQ